MSDSIRRLNEAFRARFGDAVHSEVKPEEKALQRLSVGPLEDNRDELAELAKDLYSWVAEGLSITVLRRALGQIPYEKDWKQFKLIEQLMSKGLGSDPLIVKEVLGPLKDLNALRISHAHSLDASDITFFKIAGKSTRAAWFDVVDGVVQAINTLKGRIH